MTNGKRQHKQVINQTTNKMSKTMQINPPSGFKFQSVDQSSGAINLVEIPKDIKERIQSVDDIFALNNTTRYDFEEKWKGFEDHEIGNAFEILIVAAYSEGKLPDFTDGTPKYYPLFKMGSPSGVGFSFHVCDDWFTYSHVGARLVFHGKDAKANMLDAVNKFLPQYKHSRTS
jgi:hypothetical protein